jgi:hypothetical protein
VETAFYATSLIPDSKLTRYPPSNDWWSNSTAAKGAAGAIDLSKEHHDIVRIRTGVVERFDRAASRIP